MTNVRLKLYRRGASKSKQASLNHGKGLHWIVAQLAEHAAVNRVVAASSAAFPAFHSKLPDTLKAFTQRAEVIRSRPRFSAVLETGSRGLFPEIDGGRGPIRLGRTLRAALGPSDFPQRIIFSLVQA